MKTLNLQGRSKEFVDFYNFAEEYRRKHGGIFDFKSSKSVRADSCLSAGYFDESTKRIVVALNHKKHEETFVHEFCHFMQYIEQAPVYTKVKDDFWWEMEANKWGIYTWDSMFSTIALEHDCEKRAIHFGRKYNIFNIKKYAQGMNAYMYFLQYVYMTNQWPQSTRLYDSKLPNIMPNKPLPLSTFKKIDMAMMKEYDKVFG